jgi:general secretion pathway protein A
LWIGAATALLMLVIGGAWALWDRNPQWRSVPLATSEQPHRSVEAVPHRDAPPAASATETAAVHEATAPPPPFEAIHSEPVPPSVAAASAPAAPAKTAVDRLARPPGVSAFDSQRDAYAAVFDRWQAPFEPNEVPCNQAAQAGLQCLKLNGTWHDIERLNQPVVIELWDDRAEPYYAAILSHRDDAVTIKLGGQDIETTVDDLGGHWYGSYIVLWQMPPDYRGNLKLGDEGPSVAWLRQHLAAALRADLRAADPARFDEGLRSALIRFQRENGMVPDGVAGPMTWIAMNATSPDAIPRLRAGS